MVHPEQEHCSINGQENVTLVKTDSNSSSHSTLIGNFTTPKYSCLAPVMPAARYEIGEEEGRGQVDDGCVRADAEDDALTVYAQKSYNDTRLI